MEKKYKILTKAQSDQMWKNIFSQYDERALDIMKSSDNKELKRQLVSLQHMFQLFNADFNSVLEEIKKFIDAGDFKGLSNRAHEIKQSLNKHKDILNEQIKEGLELRKSEKVKYPDLFGESDRVFISIPKINTALKNSQELFENIREAFGEEHFEIHLSDAETSYIIEYSKHKEKSHSFLSRRLELLNYANDLTSVNVQDLFNLLGMNFTEVKKIMHERQKSGDKTNVEMRKVLYDKVIFNHAKYLLKKKLEDSPYIGEQDAVKNVFWFLQKSYKNAVESIEKSTAKKSNNNFSIDTLIFSKNFVDIATMSTYVDWENNCMHVGEENFFTHIRYEIGLGTIVVNAIDSNNPFKKVAQIVLQPYKNIKDNTVIYVARNLYGTYLPELRLLVEKIVKEQINPKEISNNSIYNIDTRLYLDGGINNVIIANDFWGALNLLKIPYNKKSEQLNFHGRYIDLSGAGNWLKELPDNITNARININGGNRLKELPKGLDINNLTLSNNNSIKELPADIKANSIVLENTKITRLPDKLFIRELHLQSQKNIKSISNIDVSKLKWLFLINTGISELPEGLNLESLAITRNSAMKSWPNRIKILNNLDIRDTIISELPKVLKLKGWLDISRSNIHKISDNATAEVLHIDPITQISSLPPGIKSVNVSGKPVEEEKIKEWRANYRREHKEKLQAAKTNIILKAGIKQVEPPKTQKIK